MAEDTFDVLVIGGGITGTGIALDAAARGPSVAVAEKDDFAAGTSGRSSRLVFAPGAVRTTAALAVPSAEGDERYIFIVPWEDRVYAGTTDTPYAGDLDHPAPDDADRDYLLAAVAGLFPGVTGRDVVASWAGLRPLLGDPGDARTGDLSRRHAIAPGPFGLYTITGGKLTTYRAMAQDLVDRVAAFLGGGFGSGRCRTRDLPLGLHGPATAAVRQAREEVRRLGLPPRTAARLVQRYGDEWPEAIRLIGADPSLGEPVAVDKEGQPCAVRAA